MTRCLLPAVATIAFVGCATSTNQRDPVPRADRVLLLDNSGGYSHAGRRIELLEGGAAIETRYTDIIGSEVRRLGRHALSNGVLNLRFDDEGDQRLIRVSYGGQIFWVYRSQVKEIASPENVWLRHTSLKTTRRMRRCRVGARI